MKTTAPGRSASGRLEGAHVALVILAGSGSLLLSFPGRRPFAAAIAFRPGAAFLHGARQLHRRAWETLRPRRRLPWS
jgi:hypothetical protein